MSTTYTPYLRLRLTSDLTQDARYNLGRIDTLAQRFQIAANEDTRVISLHDVEIYPESDRLNNNPNGTLRLGTNAFPILTLEVNASIVNFSTSPGLKDQGVGGTKYLRLKYDSTVNGSVDTASDRTLTFDLQGADHDIVLGGNISLAGGFTTSGAFGLTFNLTGTTNLTLPTSGTLATLSDATYTADESTLTLSGHQFSIKAGGVTDTQVSNSAAIALSKLAALTPLRAVISNVSGVLTTSPVTSTELGYLAGAASNVQGQLDGKASRALDNLTVTGLSSGDLLRANSSSALARVPIGLPGYVLTVVGGQPTWVLPTASSSAALPHATLHDATSTSLPGGASLSIDGVTVTNAMRVLFSAYDGKVYEAAGVGVSITWAPVALFDGSDTPISADVLLIEQGDAFAHQLGQFNGTNWLFNDIVRYFNGQDYWEQSSLRSATLTNNTSSPTPVFSVSATGSEHWAIDYSITRSVGESETGTLHIAVDGSSVSLAQSNASVGTTGVVLTSDISAGNLRLLYTTTNTGTDALFKFLWRRWSSAPGGPGSVPSYTPATPSIPAAGSITGAVQFRDSLGNLSADSDFLYDINNDELALGSWRTTKLQTATLLDNQSSPQDIFSVDASSYRYILVELGYLRGTIAAVGTVLLTHDGTSASIAENTLQSLPSGVTFVGALISGNLKLQYTTTATGNSAALKYRVTKF